MRKHVSIEFFFGGVGKLAHVVCGSNSGFGDEVKLDFQKVLLDGSNEVDD